MKVILFQLFYDTKKIVFYDKNNLDINKVIKNIDAINSHNCLFSFGKYIIINCEEGIALLLIKTKEMVQYINSYKDGWKLLCSSFDNNIYILYEEYSLLRKIKFKEGGFIPIEEYKIKKNTEYFNCLICINYEDNDIIACNNYIYLLKKK